MWDELVDLISRPQQAVMGFSKEGSDQFGRTNQWVSNKGYDPGYFGVPAIMSTIPAGLKGAWKGLTGQQDYNDWNLAEGATDNPKIDSAINTGIRMTADPLGAVPFGGRSQKLGTMARTAGNLWDAKRYAPEAYDKLKSGGIWNALNMDIAHGGGGNLPTVIRSQGDTRPIMESLGYTSSMNAPLAGFTTPDSRFLVADTTRATPSWLHEFVHDTTKRFIDPQEAKAAYEAVYNASGKQAKALGDLYSKHKNNLGRVGEEYYAKVANQNTPEVMEWLMGRVGEPAKKTLGYIDDMANKRLAQVNTGAANPISYNFNPSVVRFLSNMWNEE